MRWIRNSYWFWMASSFFDPANISRNHSSSSSYTLPDRGGEHAATKRHQKISVGKSDEKNPRLDWTRAEGGRRDRGRTWCRNWWRGRRRAAGCRRGPRRCCRRRWRRRRRPPRRSTPTPCPAATASRPARPGPGPRNRPQLRAAAALAGGVDLPVERGGCARARACGSRDALGAPPALYRPRRSAAGQSGGEGLDPAGPRCR